ncbi:MAG: hypothetical protein ACRCSF_06050 [Mycobacteriaceae bacterium]
MSNESQDVRALIGMRGPAAWTIAVLYSASLMYLVISQWESIANPYPSLLAVLIISIAALGLVGIPGNPIPWKTAIFLGATAPISCSLVLWQLPITGWNGQQAWCGGASTAVLVFVSVRGQITIAWASFIAAVAITIHWTIATGQGVSTGVDMVFVNVGLMSLATYFSLTIRPQAHSIFMLREQAAQRSAAEASAAAILSERDAQLNRLDAQARPLLERIADQEIFTVHELLNCRLLEAQLRDSLRAPALNQPAINAAAKEARSRGVEVVLLDDGGLQGMNKKLQSLVGTTIEAELYQVASGTITARILPKNRAVVATILINETTGDRRIEILQDGTINHEIH